MQPADATDSRLTWTSGDSEVATVDSDGFVTAVAVGETVITAAAADVSGVKAECKVIVNPVLVSSIELSRSEWSGVVGDKVSLVATVQPADATDSRLTWTSGNPEVATVDSDGNVTAVAVGETVITAAAADGSGVKASCTVKVEMKVIKVTSITLSTTEWTGFEGATFTLKAEVAPKNATDVSLVWGSSDEVVATVDDNGSVTALKAGRAIIKATAADGSGVNATCVVTVMEQVPEQVPVAEITLSETTWTGVEGSSYRLVATIHPENATDKTISWMTSDASVATVDNDGNIKAIKVGSATITATASDGSGVKAECNVTVSPVLVASIELSEDMWGGTVGDSFSLKADVLPANATNSKISWTSSDISVAAVDADGNVTAKGIGNAVITASATDGSGVTAACSVSVVTHEIKPSSISLNLTAWDGKAGETARLIVTVLPAETTNKGISWKSDNPEIATVDDEGNVSAVSVGKTMITATSTEDPNLTATCRVTVVPISVESITLSASTWSGTVGEKMLLNATVLPEDATNRSVKWTTSDSSVAKVDAEGRVTALKVGTATITATATDGSGVSADCKIEVIPVSVASIELSESVWGGVVGESMKLTATVYPVNATYKEIDWSTDNPAVATVDNDGNVKTISPGEAVITAAASYGSGVSAECHVTVTEYLVKATSISLSASEWSGKAEESVQLMATVLPAGATNKGVMWTTSAPEIATVDSRGIVTAVSVGKATVAATTVDGTDLSATCQVTVVPTPVGAIELSSQAWNGTVGATIQLTAKVLPENATNTDIIWSTSDASIATVDNDGKVIAVGIGSATVTATAADRSGVKAECKVTVVPTLVSSIELSEYVWGGIVGDGVRLTAAVLPDDASDKAIDWSTSDASVATVDGFGSVKAVGVGEAVIIASAHDGSGVTAECHVTVATHIVKATSVSLSETEWSGKAGDGVQLKATVLPADATNKGLRWTSSAPEIAAVDSKGNVTAVKVGSATVTVTTADGTNLSAACQVTVVPTPVESITLSAAAWSGTVGSVTQLTATVEPSDATDGNVVWSSSDSSIATVDGDGNVTAVKVGTATITATAADGSGVKAECKVTVRPVLVKSIELSENAWGGLVGEGVRLTATVLPADATNKNVDWSSSDASVAAVDSEGNVKAISVGEAVITATAHDGSGVTAECQVTVSANVVKATSVSLSETEWSGKVGEGVQLKATVLPADATNKGVRWTSSAPEIAAVDSKGNVTAVNVGSAIITVTTVDGTNLSASCQVTVVPTPVETITLSAAAWSGTVGSVTQLTATVEPSDATDGNVVWSSSDSSIATVDGDGNVTAVKVGTATITATAADGSGVKAECKVTVRPVLVKSIELSENAWDGLVGEGVRLTATVLPADATNKIVDWSSSDVSVATVDSEGNLKAISVGEAVITATANDGSGVTAECQVTVSANVVKATSVSLSETEWSGKVGEGVQLKATILPADATNKGVRWTSSAPEIAAVDSKGNVTAVNVGSAIITVTTVDGTNLSATCQVNVLPVLAESLIISPNSWAGEEGQSFTIEAMVLPENTTDMTLSFESDNDNVATVDSEGLVMIVGEGTCVITVSTTDGSGLSAECIITGISEVGFILPNKDAKLDVYNQNGILIRRNCTREELKELQSGIYIVRCGTTVKTIYLRN